ncbi:MAG: molybdopterin biosynthesis protein [Deltaproteobacteria bacterium]|nr:molybdopterin biosynthesis protein [Deltaproteobacteria bacterium]MBW2048930.1 molybdopterin biosynthesis protein [Deltaproteobacteria bacterium]MBW2110841.1 molybdopterin biosynthesis protein [Deltaproteobacteria bacterium]MBW2352366.1 molybdopterin biosynthesis protein [Deltaproteobacteria bacterium]
MKRQVYLSMKSLEEAREIFFTRFDPGQRTGVETVDAGESAGRVTAEPVFARRSAPSYHSSAMDGIAVRAELTYGTTEREPKILKLGRDAVWVNTGQPLPGAFDAVIMVEKVHQIDENTLEIRSPAYPWQHVRKVGEDIVATQLLFPQNHVVRPYDVGALISGGVFSVRVWEQPRVAIIPTGSELLCHRDMGEDERLEEGRIIEYNSLVLAALVRQYRALPRVYDIVQDREDEIRSALTRAVESDAHLVIINAGSSAGTRDYTVHLIREMGEVLVHGVAMMPGKPTILGVVNQKPVVGNPGYAVSSTLSFDQFIRPLLCNLQGFPAPGPRTLLVQPTRDIPSKVGTEEFLRVNIGKVGDRYVATPLARAAGSITSLTRAEGILRIPAMSEGVGQDQETEAELIVEEEELKGTVVIIGSHDITIDILGDEIRRTGKNIRISSGNVGSLGGLLALRRGRCHMAGSHLLDTSTGEYNVSYIRRYVKGVRVSVFHLTLREQGLMVIKGNPKGIRGIEDLAGKDISFVNRQAGSGTRVLFDHYLKQAGISPEAVMGYGHEEFTHMAVAVDVLSGAADAGMGIYAAARALGLDFIPVAREQYDLIIPTAMLDQPNIQAVLETIRSGHFRERIFSLGGYDPSRSGELFMEVN